MPITRTRTVRRHALLLLLLLLCTRGTHVSYRLTVLALYPGDLDRMFENMVRQPRYKNRYDIQVLSRPMKDRHQIHLMVLG
jgi:hypothetical protein